MDIYAYWSRSENAGDRVTPWIINAMKHCPMWVPSDFPRSHLVGAGSIANHAGPNAIVWGAGIATATDPVNPKAKFLSVRGPLTRKRVLECGGTCPEVYGDPGLLVASHFIPLQQEKQYQVGIVPHVVDYLEAVEKYGGLEGVKVIRMLDTIEDVVAQIRSCEFILSTSLHGLVFTHAYGRRAAWVTMGNRVGGDGTKFRDHYLSLGLGDPVAPQKLCMVNGGFVDYNFVAPTSAALLQVVNGLKHARPF